MILGTQEKGVTRMKCVLLIGNNVLIIHRVHSATSIINHDIIFLLQDTGTVLFLPVCASYLVMSVCIFVHRGGGGGAGGVLDHESRGKKIPFHSFTMKIKTFHVSRRKMVKNVIESDFGHPKWALSTIL